MIPENLQFPVRINVNTLIEGEAGAVIREFNRSISEGGDGSVLFQPVGPAHPHVTYLMGTVADDAALRRVLNAAGAFADNLSPRTLLFGRPYVVSGRRGFVFADVIQAAAFVAEREVLLDLLGGSLALERHGGVRNPPHVTLGYVESADDVEGAAWPESSVGFERWRLSVGLVGHRGTVVDLLMTCMVSGIS